MSTRRQEASTYSEGTKSEHWTVWKTKTFVAFGLPYLKEPAPLVRQAGGDGLGRGT